MMRSTILCFVIACIVFQVYAVEDNVNKLACIREASINPSLIDKAYNGEISDARQLKCYFKCYYKNAGYMNNDGQIQKDKMKEYVPSGITKNKAQTAVDLCADNVGKDACETAYLVQKCLLNNNVKY